MELTSPSFVFATIFSAIVFYLLNPRFRIVLLVFLSLGFILSLSYLLVPYIILYSTVNFFIGKKVAGSKNKLGIYRIGLLFNLAQLILLRYANFTLDPVLHFFESPVQVSKLAQIIIPLGISYFTLQGIGYLINLKMGWEKPETNFWNFLLYIVFFPKFLSGPIERSNHFLPQLCETRSFNQEEITIGLRTILFGFFKKVAVANQLAPYVVDTFSNINSVDSFTLWIVLFLLPIYLYFDFSGYTDIAIGSARLFGINLLPNFEKPFFAVNVSTFWRRFHMSLSLWFNDYVFRNIILKRRRWGIYASVYGVFITWTLFGIWHGGGWHFMALGLLQAIALNYEFFTKRIRNRIFSKLPIFVNNWIGRIFTYIFYSFSLVFFFSKDIESVFIFLGKLSDLTGPFVIDNLSTKPISLLIYVPIILFIEMIQTDFPKTYSKYLDKWNNGNIVSKIIRWSVYSIIITIIFVVGLKAEQFVYANF